jgi:hypothetical protein
MPLVRMNSTYEQAVERGINIHLYRDSSLHTTLWRYSDGTVSVNHNPQIPLEQQPENGYEYSPLVWLCETHHGLCIHEREINSYNDSDFLMLVWNEDKQAPESIEFASTRGWSYPCYASRPDATPDVLAKYEAYQANLARLNQQAREERLARIPAKGKTIKVVKGRKVAIGTSGLCIWTGRSAYGERSGVLDRTYECGGGTVKIKQLNQLATEMVGDGKKQNVFFVTAKANVVLIAIHFETAYQYWRSLANARQESALEDRQTGVICSAGMEPQYDSKTDDFTRPIEWEVRDDSRLFGFRS